ncbi:restriction endonuclease subunit S [Citrobacter koseri]|uniref:restriction endonuclease subunit S n=1 Tax=Citrobacter koseri TaxID=545 RepID=UPI0012713532|nr:restriction endonuclease subunit S [Citrobacter koseri]EDB6716092.1 restriction endonuclease subunit S [Salmonella enterica subsp. enterica serovar Agona]EJP0573188.1 restriction endonuclease subunit S [Salmonella enterica]EJZ9978895.1 restriction endonuclease subunit S [Salmonella enterica subsp. enterica]MBJ9305908.1 restriction endonuclease subunit S [Citrobacter koseri]MBJ9369762.1 restriction endonuclease subunit S [Citrobacter koseri]
MRELIYLEKLLDGVEIEWLPIGDIADIYGGLTGKTKADFENGNAKYVSYKNIFSNINIDEPPTDFVNVKNGERQHAVRYGDVLFTGSSETAEEAGISSAITSHFDEPVYLNSFSFGIRFNQKVKIQPEFSKYLFRTNLMRAEIAKTASGVTRFNISKSRFKKVLIPVISPENPEKSLTIQSEIVRILDKFTALTAELTAELTMRKKQYNYYRDQLLSFDEGEVEWKMLGDLGENLDSKRKPITSGLREAGSIPYYGASGIVDYVKDYIFDGDFLLISEDGANLLARNTPIAFSISGKSWVNNHAHVIKFDSYAERRYVEYYLNSIDLAPYISGAAQPKLNKKNLESIRIPNPSPEDKERIVSILDKFDALTNSINEGLPREIELRQKQYEYYRDLLFSFPRPETASN